MNEQLQCLRLDRTDRYICDAADKDTYRWPGKCTQVVWTADWLLALIGHFLIAYFPYLSPLI